MQLKILYLDDEEALCELFFDEFSSPDIQVMTFTDPKKAMEEARTTAPDLMFLDYRLPGTTGDEIAQSMPPQIPKYLITGDNDVKTTYKFVAIFHKPMSTEDIRKTFQGMVDSKLAAKMF